MQPFPTITTRPDCHPSHSICTSVPLCLCAFVPLGPYLHPYQDAATNPDGEFGTIGYCAPELLRATTYDERVDNWSLGVLLFIILAGSPPFPLNKPAEARRKTLACDYSFADKIWAFISAAAEDLVTSLLSLRADDRLILDDVLHHPWLQANAGTTATEVSCSHSYSSGPLWHTEKHLADKRQCKQQQVMEQEAELVNLKPEVAELDASRSAACARWDTILCNSKFQAG